MLTIIHLDDNIDVIIQSDFNHIIYLDGNVIIWMIKFIFIETSPTPFEKASGQTEYLSCTLSQFFKLLVKVKTFSAQS
jgi:hypothetical protein